MALDLRKHFHKTILHLIKKISIAGIIILILNCLFQIMPSYGTSIKDADQTHLSEILKKSAEYCEKVNSASLYFVCREKIKEEIVQSVVGRAVISQGVAGRRSYRSVSYSPRKDKNVYIYDYQLIKKGSKIEENRTLLEENGEKKNEKDAPLKTNRFYSKRSVLGPVFFLSKDWQKKFNYKIVKEDSIKGRKAYVIEASPKPDIEEKPNYGKVWVDKEDFCILKIAVEMESLPGFKELQEKSQKRRIKPIITATHHYDVEKNGIRFPSKTVFVEEYTGRRMRRFQGSKTVITYENYRFFTVEYKVDY